jgi:hypothetical protein
MREQSAEKPCNVYPSIERKAARGNHPVRLKKNSDMIDMMHRIENKR